MRKRLNWLFVLFTVVTATAITSALIASGSESGTTTAARDHPPPLHHVRTRTAAAADPALSKAAMDATAVQTSGGSPMALGSGGNVANSLLGALPLASNLNSSHNRPVSEDPLGGKRIDGPTTITLSPPSTGYYDDRGLYLSGPPVNETQNTILTVGYLTAIKGIMKEKQGLAISGAITIAIDEINNNPHILPNVTLALRWNDTKGDTVHATRAITEMICDGVSTFFGPEGNCHVEAIVAQSRNIPMISYKCPDYSASPIPNFARTEPPDTQVTKSIISLLKYYGWNKFSIVYEGAWKSVVQSLNDQARKQNMTINHEKLLYDSHTCCENSLPCCRSAYFYQAVQDTLNRTRIYVFFGPTTSLIQFMEAMDTLKLFQDGQYMVIYVDMMTYSLPESRKFLWNPDFISKHRKCNIEESFKKRARSLLVIVSTPPVKNYEKFTEKVKEYNNRPPFNFGIPSLFSRSFSKYVSIYAAYLYDSVMLYAMALDKLLRMEERPLTEEVIRDVASNGTRIVEAIIHNKTYQSITGATIKIDKYGDSEGNFSVLSLKEHMFTYHNFTCDYHMVPVAFFIQGDDFPEYKIINASVKVEWTGDDRPFDMPSCGFANELCPRSDNHIMSMVIAGILGLILFCAVVIVMSFYRKWKIELEIEGLLWKIEPHEISGYFGNDIVASPSKLSLASAASYGSKCSNQVFTSTAKYRGVMVRIKELKFSKKKDIGREIMKEMRTLRDLRHDNLNNFIGACVEPMRILLVTDYCAKGSLYDIVENEDIKLEDIFIASLVHDLIKAMLYIHNSCLVFHGNLKSSNCVVTSRWVLQVTDFGLHDIRQCAENESIGEHQHYRNLFWRAPELLRNPNVYGSKQGDVYAFSIILYEIIGRKGPFGPAAAEPKEIIDLVRRYPDLTEMPYRPDLDSIVDTGNCPDYVMSCIQDCWNENPDVRPDFPTIRNRLKKMRGGKSKNIMDQMMEMMEKYTNNLEDIVNERTRLLCEEKRKTEDLLHRMLPQSVAEKLTRGHGVEPVSYDNVTIYFSDIVGFTAMSAESTPLQVVNFLNDLYTVFDRIIKGYDVYKVETIGDAYMVVSGLPIKNGDLHVGEVASMALDLLEAVKSHQISHRPNEVLKLRIGMHTGPVVAGVVGLTMPRYCLFGDTVNTASRMESNGEALKIHISPDCKTALDILGGYITEVRGPIYMKGKGEVLTHWLTGATEGAIERKPVSLDDLPPPLFCRPRKSPKCESRQPSLIAGSCFGIPNLNCGSRRQSQVPKCDIESTSSLHGTNGSPRALHRIGSKLDRTPLYLNHGSRNFMENDHHQDQMEMGHMMRKKHSVSMDGQEDDGEDPMGQDEQTKQLLVKEQTTYTNAPPQKTAAATINRPRIVVGGGGITPCNNNDFQTFNEKRATFDPNLLVLRESRSLDRFPSSDQRKKRLSFKRLTSKLTFSNNNRAGSSNNQSHSGHAQGNNDGCGGGEGAVVFTPVSVLVNANIARIPSNGSLQSALAAPITHYRTAPNSSDSNRFYIENSKLALAGVTAPECLLPLPAPPPPAGTKLANVSCTDPSEGCYISGYQAAVNSNGYFDASDVSSVPNPDDEAPLLDFGLRRQEIIAADRRKEPLHTASCRQQSQSESEAGVDRCDKRWRSMDTLKKHKRMGSVGGGDGHSGFERDYYFEGGGSGHDSASDDNHSGYHADEDNRRINFSDDLPSGDEGSDTNWDNETAAVPHKARWFKNIFNNGNENISNHNRANHKPENVVRNQNNNNNNNSNKNKNHKRFNFNAKMGALQPIEQSPESKEDDGSLLINTFLDGTAAVEADAGPQDPTNGTLVKLKLSTPPPFTENSTINNFESSSLV